MNDLPKPLTPADCDLTSMAVPRDMLIELSMAAFGLSAEDAAELLSTIEPYLAVPLTPVGRG
ncbi:hypothetical protein [Burkholderia gladioli]|uniref:hypothetical protein n=1 Tax=Burkholderia gladioli TaxID=28095 RepID=UPI00163EED1B|nr:hypothetical protein [Burkholderia gladioli]